MVGEPSGLGLSASKELESGARATLLLAEGLFRLDVILDGDTLRTVVRNLSSGRLETTGKAYDDSVASFVIGEVAAYEPAHTSLEFALGSGSDRVEVRVLVGVLHFAQRGTFRLTGQAVIRRAPLL